jgi:hypothetical protein
MAFVWSHRGQCGVVEWNWPPGEFIPASLKEPRHDRKPHYYWMARPVDLREALRRKAAFERFDGELEFAVDDPCVPANTGHYTIRGESVDFDPIVRDDSVPLSLLSSVLFGRLTVEEASLQTALPFPIDVASRLFRPRRVFITEQF